MLGSGPSAKNRSELKTGSASFILLLSKVGIGKWPSMKGSSEGIAFFDLAE
jgi:hypothetical protein